MSARAVQKKPAKGRARASAKPARPRAGKARGARTESSRSTPDRILDSAEKLFARRGFHGVSIRDITQDAGVDVALVNYHFGTKQALLDSVLTRRSVVLNDERMQRLQACLAKAGSAPPSIDAVIDAFTRPLLDRSLHGGPGWKAYFALIAQVNNSTEFGGVIMTRYFDPVVRVFVDSLRRALPGCDPRDIYWSYHFLSGALTLSFAETGRIDNLSGGICRSADLDAVHERLVPFVASGFRALCARSAAQRGRKRARPRTAGGARN